MVASLPGFAALLALLFTWMQVTQTGKELRISEQGQITNRFNAAINNLGSASLDERLGGIYALGRIMDDSARDHPTVVSVLSAYLRTHAAAPAGRNKPQAESGGISSPRADVQAVMTVLGNRRSDFDKGVPVDLRRTSLRGVQLDGRAKVIPFREAVFSEADLSSSSLSNLDLRGAWLDKVNLSEATLTGSRLDDAFLAGANFAYADLSGSRFHEANLKEVNFTGVHFCGDMYLQPAQGSRGEALAVPGRARSLSHAEGDRGSAVDRCADLTNAELIGADLTNALLPNMNFTGTIFCPDPSVELGSCSNLHDAILSESILRGAYLSGANLNGTDLRNADVRNVDFTNADLRNADLTGAKTSGARFEGANLKGASGPPCQRERC
ncbi:pentapeptide repeat-containing protein [Streptomyces sp. NPDC097941]|uniref:pentapeptide repeat-containing protein n=1 Tax=Streptomyces sp. NPDC097941 TaxID=3155685 RepID=UPI00331D83A0